MNEVNMGLLVRRETRRAIAQVIESPVEYPNGYPQGNEPPAGNGFLNVLAMLRRRIGLVAGVFGGVMAIGLAFTLLQTPTYTSTALLVINPNPDQIVPDKQLSNSRGDATAVDSEIEVLKSPALSARLVNELHLAADPDWNSELKKSSATPAVGQAPPGAVVDAVSEAMKVRRRGLSNVVEVAAESKSADQAAQMANGLANIYLKSLAEARFDTSEKANGWLKDRLGELRSEVQQKQAAAQAYRAQRNLLTASGVSLVESQVAQIQSSLLQTRAEYAQKKEEYEQLSGISNAGKTVATLNSANDAMRDLISKQAEVTQKIANMQSRYGPSYPPLQAAMDEKAAIDARVADEMKRAAGKSKVERDTVAARLNAQEAELNTLRGQLVSGNFDEVRLHALETDAQSAESVYENFLQRYHEIAREGMMTGVGAWLLSAAQPERIPTSPHLLLNGALVLAAALVLAVLAGLLAEQFRGTVETTDEVQQRVGVRALVAVPSLTGRDLKHIPSRNRSPTAYLLTKRLSQFAEAFRVLQTAIKLANTPRTKVVAITSAMPGEGKTTISLGLARVAAMGGQSAIIVDCDVRMRSVNKVLGIEPEQGLQQVLAGEKNWRDVVGRDEASGAHVLPASGLTNKDIFTTGAMESLIDELSKQYDLVVLDCAPVFAVAETRLIASLADSVVVAARARRTPAKALAAAIAQLEIGGANVLGVALNRVNLRRGRRSFYDGLYYSKAFSGYYTREA